MSPSDVYNRLLDLAKKHAEPSSPDEVINIRTPDAIHTWGHKYLVSCHPVKLGEQMDNKTFRAHLTGADPYVAACTTVVHSIIVDEHQRAATIHMSYNLQPVQSDEKVEQDLVWMLKFTDDEAIEKILIKETKEFIDPTAGERFGQIVQEKLGSRVSDNLRGGLSL